MASGLDFFYHLYVCSTVLYVQSGGEEHYPSSDIWSIEFQQNGASPPPNTAKARLASLVHRERNANVKHSFEFCTEEALV